MSHDRNHVTPASFDNPAFRHAQQAGQVPDQGMRST